jgi:hypothetical protein
MKTTAQQAQKQRAGLIVTLQALDPQRAFWTLGDTYADLRAAIYYISDRTAAADERRKEEAN